MSSDSGIFASISVAVTRLALSFWVGGAVLFVMTSVAEQRHSQFDSVIRDQLATIRFPYYYLFGWTCLGTAISASALAAILSHGCLRKRMLAAFAFTILSTAIAVLDYGWVYRPLQELISPPGLARTEQFITLHQRSRTINEVHLSLALIGALIACLPEKHSSLTRRPSPRSFPQ